MEAKRKANHGTMAATRIYQRSLYTGLRPILFATPLIVLCGMEMPSSDAETLADLVAYVTVMAMVVASSQTELNPIASARRRIIFEEGYLTTDNRDARDRAIRSALIAVDTLPGSRIVWLSTFTTAPDGVTSRKRAKSWWNLTKALIKTPRLATANAKVRRRLKMRGS